MTPARQEVYDQAMASLADPVKLRVLAEAYRKEGLNYEANMLHKRAALRELPPDVKKGRQEVYRQALKSTDKEAIAKVANAFEREGALGAAQKIRDYLSGLPWPKLRLKPLLKLLNS